MKSRRRLFRLTPALERATKWVFKVFVDLSHEIAENIETYLPGLTYPKDGISPQAFGAFFGVSFIQLQIGSSALGHGKDKPCSMRYLAKQAKYSSRHFFRIQVPLVEAGHVISDHDAQGLPAKREYTSKFWAAIRPLLQKHFKVVPKEVKDRETIERWIGQLIEKGRNYFASQERVKALAQEKPPADLAVGEAAMRQIREMLKGGGDPAPAA